MASKTSKKYFLMELEGFTYCVRNKDLLTADVETCNVQSEVAFKYGSKTYQGLVLWISDKEKSVLLRMKEIKKERKQLRRQESSIDASKPRKAAAKQKAAPEEGKQKRSKKLREKKALALKKAAAEAATEATLSGSETEANGVQNRKPPPESAENIPSDLTESSSSGRSSDTSSLFEEHSMVKANGKAKDVAALISSQSGSDTSRSGSAAAVDPSVEQHAPPPVLPCSVNPEKTPPNSTALLENGDKVPAVSDIESVKSKEALNSIEKDSLLQPSSSGGNRKRCDKEDKKVKDKKAKDKARDKKKKKNRQSKRDFSSESSDSSSSSDSSDSESESSDSSDSDSEPPRKKHKTKKSKEVEKVRRNNEVYTGQNYVYFAVDDGDVKVHDDYTVYAKSKDLSAASLSPTVSQFVRQLVSKVYPHEALTNATPEGFPPRGKGARHYSKKQVPPKLHPDGWKAIIAKAEDLQEGNKTWRPRTSAIALKGVFCNVVCCYKNQ